MQRVQTSSIELLEKIDNIINPKMSSNNQIINDYNNQQNIFVCYLLFDIQDVSTLGWENACGIYVLSSPLGDDNT